MDGLNDIWNLIMLERVVHLDDKESTVSWMYQVGLLDPAPPQCRCHRSNMKSRAKNSGFGKAWFCQACKNRGSDNEIQITHNSIFADMRLEPGIALILLWNFSQGNSYKDTERDCKFGPETIGSDTIAHWFSIFRQRLYAWMNTEPRFNNRIGGPGKIVQIDEAQIGRRMYHRGRLIEEVWVLGMIDEDDQLRLEVIEDRSAAVMIPLIESNVDPQSVVWTDGHRSYLTLDQRGWNHHTVNHSREFVAPDGTHTNKIESQWRAIRRWFSPGGIRHENIEATLKYYLWFRDLDTRNANKFAELVKICKYE